MNQDHSTGGAAPGWPGARASQESAPQPHWPSPYGAQPTASPWQGAEWSAPPEPPAVWPWFIAYCIVMAIMYLLVAACGAVVLAVDPRELDMEPLEARILGSVYLGLGVLLLVPFAAAPLLPKRRWVWVYDIVLIALGMTSLCCLPATIPLLICWIKPETRVFFGWR
jgi:hypothetical protein